MGDAVVLDDPPLGDLDAADVGRHDAAHVGRHASSRPQSSRHGYLDVLRRSSASPSNGRSDRVPNHPHVAIRRDGLGHANRDGLAHANHGHAANESHAAKAVTRESVEFFQVQLLSVPYNMMRS